MTDFHTATQKMLTEMQTAIQMITLLSIRKPGELKYARSMASTLNLPISLFTGNNELPNEAKNWPDLSAMQSQRLQMALPGIQVISSLDHLHGSIIISNSVARKETGGHRDRNLIVLAPQDESGFDPHEKKKIMIPFGRLDTFLKCLPLALAIAKQTDSTLVFFHTTRPEPTCSSNDWHDHMVANARETESFIVTICSELNINHEIIITSVYPKVIAEGVAEAALQNGCHLIIMAVADEVVFGSHTEQVLNYSPTPTLIVV
ncbi:hypothetical protein COT97_02790 [Candidatus Falkowbacteria bacterium CG10_big_fil_rev_8_21_14_0_10_39_11]|uniref:UspA domain-containing protein n=1 Tax=Candidatus Falkowbacteria bacterium CG10_big_fil_rev_8_21_14_0_10_39_11 TaxID=1974565 RepID=A0A2H0V4X2_9BACT|nr:MAG: hypothetical protein COT97_02790 [Candidatus Falkowbacteria bacterium CG10_big_fil_rev_8_21_14_0_10_39_11]